MSATAGVGKRLPLAHQELKLIARFQASYNAIDQHLRALIPADEFPPFKKLLSKAAQSGEIGLRPDEVSFLKVVADARNLIVHSPTHPDAPIVTPARSVVVRLEGIRSRLLRPRSAIKAFGKRVATVSAGDPLTAVFARIAKTDFSQFPVYAGERFVGLLTENGITRWIASRADRADPAWDRVSVADVFRSEEGRACNYAFLGPASSVLDVRRAFWGNPLLEAALLTQDGTDEGRLIGIATRWDLATWRDE